MKRMVLIPEEKLLQYERQQGDVSCDNPKDSLNTQHGQGEKEEKERELLDDVIVRGIPKTMKTRAIALLERLRARSDVISWDDTGQVKIDGVFIPKSNISDLISSAMRPRKYFNPIASAEFFGVLDHINVPKDLVRNEEGWKKVHAVNGSKRSWESPFEEEEKQKGKRKRAATQGQQGGTTFPLKEPYMRRWYNIEKKRKKSATRKQKGGGMLLPGVYDGLEKLGNYVEKRQKGGGKLRKIPHWECYKG